MSVADDQVRNSITRRSGYSNEENKRGTLNNHDSIDDYRSSKGENEALLGRNEAGGNEEDAKFLKRDGLKPIHFSAYAVGHVYNDLCATCWFLYLLYFLTDVRGWSEAKAGFAVLSGQIADGLATQLVGYLSDRFNPRIGKRALWYIIGFAIVLPCFFGTLNICFICEWACGNDDAFDHPHCSDSTFEGLRLFYYLLLPALFNVGWASVQISTMSVVVSISQSQRRRDRLVSLRNGFTYVSSLFVLVLAAIFFRVIDDATEQFRALVYVITGLGVALSSFYIIFVGVQEVRLTNDAQYYDKLYKRKNMPAVSNINNRSGGQDSSNETPADTNEGGNQRQSANKKAKDWKGWLTDGAFYIHGGVYMFARLAMNLTMTAIPFYLKYVLEFTSDDEAKTPIEIALVPLCSYFCSIIYSILFYQRMIQYFGNRLIPLLLGVLLVCGSSIPFLFMAKSFRWLVYICCGVQGIGIATMLNTATSLISDVIGDDEQSSAFVYGSYSLLDKFCSGLVLTSITSIGLLKKKLWLRLVSGGLPITSAVLCFLLTWLGQALYKHKMRALSVRNKK